MHTSTEISFPPVNTSTLEVDVQPSLEEITPLETHSSEATAHMVKEKTTPSKVFSFLSIFLENLLESI